MSESQTTKVAKPEQYWAIKNEHGFYTGVWQTRREAIIFHKTALGKPWLDCYGMGDRAVRVLVTEIIPAPPVVIKRKRTKPGQKGVLEYRRKYGKRN
jgi:hypothetical protein